MVRAWSMVALALAGCAVDPSGVPGDDVDVGVADGDGGPVEPDAQIEPPDARVSDARVDEDAFVPPPDMCTPTAEVCNGVDDDCNGAIDDGLVPAPCDGDADGCMDGWTGCASGGVVTCDDAPPVAGSACDGPDLDMTADGSLVCVDSVLVCEGDCTPTVETCDRTDENCDGQVDDGGACDQADVTCTSFVDGGRVYLFCTRPGGLDRDSALKYCEDSGYDLVEIESDAERMFLAMHTGGMPWWTRAHIHSDDTEDRQDASQWHWRGGSDILGGLWDSGEPSGNGSCALLRGSGFLNDRDCSAALGFICEAPFDS